MSVAIRKLKNQFLMRKKRGAMKRLLFAISLTLLSGLSASTSSAQKPQTPSPQADNPAVRRAKELAQVINAGKLAEARKYVQENYAPGFLNRSEERRVGKESRSRRTRNHYI